MILPDLEIPDIELATFCRRWKVAELSLFGSALRDDFGPESDVDLLVTFKADARWSLLDHVRMEEEARSLFGRDVDIVTRRAVERSRNPIRRQAILGSSRMIYAAG
ncbi:MAG TPA: nucleotidyltransferase domain-containing protein [Rhodothermales bacterium]|nr:nucleotidyltransferase domain-containing protein [Rhodothermales bacterium]